MDRNICLSRPRPSPEDAHAWAIALAAATRANPAELALTRLPAPPALPRVSLGLCPAVPLPLVSMARRLCIRRMGRRA